MRQAGQLGVLTLMIVLALIGLAVHVLWIVVIILMAVLRVTTPRSYEVREAVEMPRLML